VKKVPKRSRDDIPKCNPKKKKGVAISALCNCSPFIKTTTHSGREVALATCNHMCKPFNCFPGDVIANDRKGNGLVRGIGMIAKDGIYFVTPFFKFDCDSGCTYFNDFWKQKITLIFRPKYEDDIAHQTAKGALVALNNIFKDEGTKDVTLVLNQKKTIKCHKIILCNRSAYFKAMLSTEFAESKTNEIVINEEHVEVFEEIIGFLYGHVIDIGQERILEISNMASKYEILDLVNLCQKSLCDLFSVENILEITNLMIESGETECFSACCRYIHEHYSDISGQEGFAKLISEDKKDNSYAIKLKSFLKDMGRTQ